jgi:predicted nucleotidyltransferase
VAIYQFGSHGTPFEIAGSDLDLAVYAGKPLPAAEVWFVAQELAVLVGRDVDIVDLGAASTVMRAQVVSTGERLWCSEEVACEKFEDYVYSSYARLQEERRGIVEDVLKRGSVYGR